MAVVGYLGKSASEGIIFEVSEWAVRTMKNWTWSGSARYAVHNRHNYHALTEYTGMDPDKITFDIILKVELGVKPLDDIEKIWTYEREGTALALAVGRKKYGKYRWNITKHDTVTDKLTKLQDTKAAIKSAIIGKGQAVADTDAFSSYPAKITAIQTGVDTSDATAAAGDILSGKTAYAKGSKVTGTIATKTASNLTASGATVTVPAGYYASQATKSVTTATQATPSISVDSAGKITASATQSAGYVSAGTKSATQQMTTLAAQTIVPGKVDYPIASGTYLTGTQTIRGDADLTAANIKNGVEIFGVTGTYTSDATATAAGILKGQTAYVNGQKLTGTLTIAGKDWTTATLPSAANWQSVTYGAGKFVAVASYSSNKAAYSTDGINWMATTLPSAAYWGNVTYGGGKFVAIEGNSSSTTNKAAYSTDGITWTAATLPSQRRWRSVTYGGGKFVAVAYNSAMAAYSTDGITWTEAPMPSSSTSWESVTYGGGKFVAVSINSAMAAYSTDGIHWNDMSMPSSAYWDDVTYGGGKFVAVAGNNSNKAAYSTDGITWTAATLPSSGNWDSMAYGAGKFFAMANSGGKAAYSTDGITWTAVTMPSYANRYSVTYGGGKFVTVASVNSNEAAYSCTSYP